MFSRQRCCWILLGLLLLLLLGCFKKVRIPGPGETDPVSPVITIGIVPSGSSGSLDTAQVSSNATVTVRYRGARIVILAFARNPRGVRDFQLVIRQGENTLFTVTTTGTAINGMAPDLLSIIGTNGVSGDALLVNVSTVITVTASAANFGNTTSTITLRLVPDDPPPPPPPPPAVPPPATLAGSYSYDYIGTQPSDQTVVFTGTLQSQTGPTGDTSFSRTVTARTGPGGIAVVPFSVSGLRPGSWALTASPRGGPGPRTCPATVPGIVRMSVAQGLAPCS